MNSTVTHCRSCNQRLGPGRWDAKRSALSPHICVGCEAMTPLIDEIQSPVTPPNIPTQDAVVSKPTGSAASASFIQEFAERNFKP